MYILTHISHFILVITPQQQVGIIILFYTLKKIKWLREVNLPKATWPEGIIR